MTRKNKKEIKTTNEDIVDDKSTKTPEPEVQSQDESPKSVEDEPTTILDKLKREIEVSSKELDIGLSVQPSSGNPNVIFVMAHHGIYKYARIDMANDSVDYLAFIPVKILDSINEALIRAGINPQKKGTYLSSSGL
jgi:hypothetical protein